MRRRHLLALGGIAGLCAVVFRVLPSLPGPVSGLGSLFTAPLLVAGLAVLVAGFGAVVALRAAEPPGSDPPFETAPEQPRFHELEQVGATVDDPFDAVTGSNADLSSVLTRSRRSDVRRELRNTAVEVLANVEDISQRRASDRIAEGHWTDDERAADLLGDGDATRPSLSTRVEDWLAGAGFERRVRATVAELVELSELQTTESAGSTETARIDPDRVDPSDRSGRASGTVTDTIAETTYVPRWERGVVVAFVLVAAGFGLGNVTIALSAIVPMVYVGYGFVTRPPAMALDVTRTVAETAPSPGDDVAVALTVENVAEHPIPEVRVVDGVPEAVPVVGGTPRGCDSLRPGESLTVTYRVRVTRGEHEFGETRLWTRNVSGSVERSASATLSTELTATGRVDSMAITDQTTPYPGRIPTDAGGQGVEFYATREYQPTDPLKQIDWNFWARTGEPRTIEFRQNRAATVVVVLDDREPFRKSPTRWSPDAVTMGRRATALVADALLEQSNAVGAATLASGCLQPPGRGREQLRRLRSFLAATTPDTVDRAEADAGEDSHGLFENVDRSGSWSAPGETTEVDRAQIWDGGVGFRWLRKRLPGDAQVVFVTPLLDDYSVLTARRLDAEGHDVTVLSPDVTSTDSPGRTVARIRRRERLRDLRRRRFRVVDWPTDSPLSLALERAEERWSR